MNTVTVSDANVTTTGDLVKEIVLKEYLVSYSAQLKYSSYIATVGSWNSCFVSLQ